MPIRSRKLPSHTSQDLPDVLSGLTDKRRKFAEQYALYHQQTKACRLAGISEDYGYHLFHDPAVRAAIAYYEHLYAEQAATSPEKVLWQWSQMANIDITDFLTDDYDLKPMSQLTAEQRKLLGSAMVGIKVTSNPYGRNVEAKFAKVEALEALSKLFGLYAKDETRGEGLTLHINMGQSTTLQPADHDLGAFSMRLGDDASVTHEDATELIHEAEDDAR